MLGLGFQELLVIFGIFLLLFGVRKLPEIGKGLGEGIRNFKWSLKQVQTLNEEDNNDEENHKNSGSEGRTN